MMTIKNRVTDLAVSAIGQSMGVLVLRGTDDAARDGGDVDILVPQGEAKNAALVLSRAAREVGLAIIEYRDIGYIVQLCLYDPEVGDSSAAAIKVDLWDGIAWQSLGRDSLTPQIIELAETDHAKAVAVTTFLQKLMYAGRLRKRDKARVYGSVSEAYLRDVLESLGLQIPVDSIRTGSLRFVDKWRLRWHSCTLRSWQTPVWLLRVLLLAITRRTLGASRGIGSVISITGANETEMLALANHFCEVLNAAEFRTPVRMHGVHGPPLRSVCGEGLKNAIARPRQQSSFGYRVSFCYLLAASYVLKLFCLYHAFRGKSVLIKNTAVSSPFDATRVDRAHRDMAEPLLRSVMPSAIHLRLRSIEEPGVCECPSGGFLDHEDGHMRTRVTNQYGNISRAKESRVITRNESADMVFRSYSRQLSDEYIARITP